MVAGQLRLVAGYSAGAPRVYYHRPMKWIVVTAGGLYELALLGAATRFRFRGTYWRWRIDTAFGDDPARWPPRRQRIRAALDYGRWVYRMKRGR